jgi:hypothetical protein
VWLDGRNRAYADSFGILCLAMVEIIRDEEVSPSAVVYWEAPE